LATLRLSSETGGVASGQVRLRIRKGRWAMEDQLPRFPGPLASRGLRLKPGPCHFGYEVGDEIIDDGENFIGRICLQITPLLNKWVPSLYSVGPRYVNPFS